jgi:hypothetical protein
VRPPISAEVEVQNAVLTSRTGVTVSNDKTNVQCAYDLVFGETSEQVEVFDNVKPLLNDVLNGINGTVFAYGQTSAGKSHTMIGPNGGANVLRGNPENWGLLPRASEYLLNTLAEKERQGLISYKVTVSFMEIYNETLTDLLSSTRRDVAGAGSDRWQNTDEVVGGSGLKIREMARSNESAPPPAARGDVTAPQEVYVAGLSEFRVHTAADVMKLVAIGTNNRKISSTDYNDSSSRSHAVLQLSFEIEKRGDTGEAVIHTSKLSLADLAGSEKIDTSSGMGMVGLEATGEQLQDNKRHIRELTSINKSLSCLGNVISALSSTTRTHIPYRESKLTRLLQDSLGGNTRTVLIACCAPTNMHVNETISTLQFADRAKSVMLKVKANTVVDDKAALARAREEIRRLQGLLAKALTKLEGGGSADSGAAFAAELRGESLGAQVSGGGGYNRDADAEVGTRERLLEQENAALQEENERLRAQLRGKKRGGKGEKGNQQQQQQQQQQPLRQSQSSSSALVGKGVGGGRKKLHSSASGTSLANNRGSYFADRNAGQYTHTTYGNSNQLQPAAKQTSAAAVRVYGSSSSTKLVNNLKRGLSNNNNAGQHGQHQHSPSHSLSPTKENVQHQHFSGFASTVIAQATQGDLDHKQATLQRINDQARTQISSAEKAMERLNKRGDGLSTKLDATQTDLKGEQAYLDSLTAARESMERQLAELAGSSKKKKRAGSSRRRKREKAAARAQRELLENAAVDGDREDEGDEKGGDYININGMSLGGARAESLRMSVQNASMQQQLSSPSLSPVQQDMKTQGIPHSIAGILTPKSKANKVAAGSAAPAASVSPSPMRHFGREEQQQQEYPYVPYQQPVDHGEDDNGDGGYYGSPNGGGFYGDGDDEGGEEDENYDYLNTSGFGANDDSDDTGNGNEGDKITPVPSPIAELSQASQASQLSSQEEVALFHSEDDAGRCFQMFSFLKNDWVEIRVDGYDQQTGAHKITHVASGKNEWQNLRRKAVRASLIPS